MRLLFISPNWLAFLFYRKWLGSLSVAIVAEAFPTLAGFFTYPTLGALSSPNWLASLFSPHWLASSLAGLFILPLIRWVLYLPPSGPLFIFATLAGVFLSPALVAAYAASLYFPPIGWLLYSTEIPASFFLPHWSLRTRRLFIFPQLAGFCT